ncbi:DUF2799 domain-containing protein [Chitinibacter tainanensis]|uniref:DUF2799 domain-containing protein n=1 Tax=Chitinibacter tainanensis TaxID=230667 RepID=UPI000419BF5C|nr:DUF2799 domain-containing protein [Chitinibacter tainanensis]
MRCLIPVALLLLTTGCASLSDSECRTGDWYSIGLRDGQNGYSSQVAEHAKACRKQRVAPDLEQYNRGREEGLRSYCTASNGYQVGLRGAQAGNVCPAGTQAAFQNAYQRGYQRYKVQQELQQVEWRIDNYNKQRGQLEEKLRAAQTDKDRRKYERELDNLRQQNRDDRRLRDILRAQVIALPLLYSQ